MAFVGRSTEHRESYLVDVKHSFDILHVAHGVFGDRLLELLRETDVAINLHNEPYPSFENRVSLHLAAANLVISEPLSPTHGLEPGIDYIEVRHPEDLRRAVGQIHLYPDLHRRVRIRGRRKAEAFRASRVYPRLVHDLLLDIEVFGTERVARMRRPWRRRNNPAEREALGLTRASSRSADSTVPIAASRSTAGISSASSPRTAPRCAGACSR